MKNLNFKDSLFGGIFLHSKFRKKKLDHMVQGIAYNLDKSTRFSVKGKKGLFTKKNSVFQQKFHRHSIDQMNRRMGALVALPYHSQPLLYTKVIILIGRFMLLIFPLREHTHGASAALY